MFDKLRDFFHRAPDALRKENDELEQEIDKLRSEVSKLQNDKWWDRNYSSSLEKNYKELQDDYQQLKAKYAGVQTELIAAQEKLLRYLKQPAEESEPGKEMSTREHISMSVFGIENGKKNGVGVEIPLDPDDYDALSKEIMRSGCHVVAYDCDYNNLSLKLCFFLEEGEKKNDGYTD